MVEPRAWPVYFLENKRCYLENGTRYGTRCLKILPFVVMQRVARVCQRQLSYLLPIKSPMNDRVSTADAPALTFTQVPPDGSSVCWRPTTSSMPSTTHRLIVVCWRERKRRVFIQRLLYTIMYISKRSGMDHTVLPANRPTPCLPFLRKRSLDGATPRWGNRHPIAAYYSCINPEGMKGWVGLVGWHIADGLST